MTIDEILAGLQAGKTLRIDQRNDPLLPVLLKMEQEGVVVSEFVEVDEQYSYLKFKWLSAKEGATGE